MFATTILFCFLQYGEMHCLTAEDSRGPYKTYEQCVDRSHEMAAAVMSIHPNAIVRGFKCTNLEGENT